MSLQSVLYFFVLSWCLGFSVMFFIRKKPENFWERNLMSIGFGLGLVPLLGVILDHMRIMIHWGVFLAIALLVPACSAWRYIRKGKKFSFDKKAFRLTRSNFYILLALIMCAVLFAVYLKGAFTYPYLEDDDPWTHASGVKFVKETNSISFPEELAKTDFNGYLEPYPPGYDILMGLLYQLDDNVIWTLKFFNVLLISLIGIFFYFFANLFLGDRKKALFATFVITIIPCFLSHFIWASTLAILLFFPALYSLERIRDDTRWMLPAIICIAGMIVTQMSNPFIFGIFFVVYFAVKSFSARKVLWKVLLAGVIGALIGLSLFWIPMVAKYGLEFTARANSFNLDDLDSITTAGSGGGLLYTWSDFMIARTTSKMDNPVGVGVFLFWLALFSVMLLAYSLIRRPRSLLSPKNSWKLVSLVWMLIAFMGIHGNRLPFPMLMPHRWWAMLAIGLAFVSVEGFFFLGKISKRLRIPIFFTLGIVLIGIVITSGYPKYAVETSFWPPGVRWGSMDELQGYMTYVQPLPYNTKVFPLCSQDFKVLAFDKLSEPWLVEYYGFKKEAFGLPLGRLHSWLDSRGYEYLTLDSYCAREYDVNEINEKLQALGNATGKFMLAGSNPGFFMFRVL